MINSGDAQRTFNFVSVLSFSLCFLHLQQRYSRADMSRDESETASTPSTASPKPNLAYIQVPSSSPIQVRSSPSKDVVPPPSMTQLDNDKEKQLERKRQAIRNHEHFPMLRKKFYYLSESDIFKGFIKGKGNLRLISTWLSENFDRNAIVGQQDAERKQQLELQKKQQEELNRQKLISQIEEQERQQQQQQQKEVAAPPSPEPLPKLNGYDDEDASPVKVRGKARVKSSAPVPANKPPSQRLGSLNDHVSTKVNLQKPKMSILEKYKYKPKTQSLLDLMLKRPGATPSTEEPKRRRLVRASSSNPEEKTPSVTPTPTPPPVAAAPIPSALPNMNLAAKFGYPEPKQAYSKLDNFIQDDDEDVEVEDDLDKIEQRIKENRRRAREKAAAAKNQPVHVISDDDLEDDDASDDMSEEDDENGYITSLTSIDNQILEFLNNAPAQDILEIANIAPKVANLLVSKRPFGTIFEILEEKFELEDEVEDSKEKKRRGGQRKTLGLKIIENTEFSLKGYKAVDSLVKQCSEYGDAIAEQMKKWGVTFTGEEGELEVVDLHPSQDNKDIEIDEENDDDVVVLKKRTGLSYIDEKPELLSPDIDLKNYQLVGINWLNLLYHNKLSCILADEMGLGKTCQVISFMAHLKALGLEASKGLHLVIVPSSTLENWLREFHKFCPDIVVQAYYGSQSEREQLRYELQDMEYDVLVTTYNLATGAAPDFKFLRNHKFNMIVYDEGHMLKNSTSERYNKLMRLTANFRLLLTGTPLQNNLKELVSLLAFMLPKLFNEKREDLQGLFSQKVSISDKSDKNYNPLLSIQAISKAKTMMTPFVLRRKKVQVLKHLPAKVHEVLHCQLAPTQKELYDKYLDQGKQTRLERIRRKALVGKEAEEARKIPIPSSSNVMMLLRKASMHPLLFRHLYTDDNLTKMAKLIMGEPEYVEANEQYILEDMKVMSDYELNLLCGKYPKTLGKFTLDDEEYLKSGKVEKLIEVLTGIIKKGEKVLIFSLFTQMLDILEKVLTISNMKFIRLDGQTAVDTRQDLIDKFYEDDTIPVFLLSTKAGGFGINLVAANNVVIYDQSFNPHDDKQAEDRAHRVGQTNEVTVYKLITEHTIEESMLLLAENKLQLDQSISGQDNDGKFEEKTASMFEKLLFDS